jgi:hypothetical protein
MVPIPLALDPGLAGSVALSGWLRLGALSRGKPLTGGGGHGDDGASCAPSLEAMSRFNPQSLALSVSWVKTPNPSDWAAAALWRRDLLGGVALGRRGCEGGQWAPDGGVLYGDGVLPWPAAAFPVVLQPHLLPCLFFLAASSFSCVLMGDRSCGLVMFVGSSCEEVILLVVLPWASLLVCSCVL